MGAAVALFIASRSISIYRRVRVVDNRDLSRLSLGAREPKVPPKIETINNATTRDDVDRRILDLCWGCLKHLLQR